MTFKKIGLLFLLISLSCLSTSSSGRHLVKYLAKESGKTHEELSTELKLQHKEACTTVHDRLLIDNTRDYGTYDPAPAFDKPAFKLIPN